MTICHSRTRDLAAHARDADVVVAAVGEPALVAPDDGQEGAAVVDVGINRTEAGSSATSTPARPSAPRLITPVPGGVGPMTIAMLLGTRSGPRDFAAGCLLSRASLR